MSISTTDAQNIWHPFTQSYGAALPIPIVSAKGLYLYKENGDKVLDAVSSWWTSIHGHCHPYIAQKIAEQASTLDHVIFAGFTHPKAVELSQKILKHLPSAYSKVFFSDDGSTAVEVGIKMALQYWSNIGKPKRKIIAFKESYHGDTFGAMSVGDRNEFTAPFHSMLFEVHFIQAPFKGFEEEALQQLSATIDNETAAFIFEPLLMGTAGMKMYSAEVLDKMISICESKNVLTIADEVLTGFYRTGEFFAIHQLKNIPSIVCLSKGITGGTMALGATVCESFIYDAFVSEDKFKTFFHGHSYTANAIACAAACANFELLEKEECKLKIKNICDWQLQWTSEMKKNKVLKEARSIGTVVALELSTSNESSYFEPIRDKIYNHFIGRNILLRPLGNVIYVLPPYCIEKEELDYLYNEITLFLNDIHEENRK